MSAPHLITTILVFLIVYGGMALGRLPGLSIDRTGIALLGGLVLVLSGVVTGPQALNAIDFPTLFVLFALMVLSAQFAVCGFYDHCAARLAATQATPTVLLALTTGVSGLLSAILANDVVVFAMTPMLCQGIRARGLDPRPFVIALAGGANAGSAATIIGNPQNILIGQAGDLGFWSFLAACGPVALGGLVSVFLTVWMVWHQKWQIRATEAAPLIPAMNRPALAKAIAATAILLILFTTPLPHTTGALAVAGALMVSRRWPTRGMLAYVDWPLLVLFGGLFIVTATLGFTGMPATALDWLAAQGLSINSLPTIAVLSLIGSNTIGNVPIVMLLLSAAPDLPVTTLHAVAALSTLAGNLFIVGSLANIIALERARDVGVLIDFSTHARCGVPMTVMSFALALPWLLFFA